jgi:alanine dehydrogenase
LAYLDDIFGTSVQTLYSTDIAIKRAVTDAELVIGAVLLPGRPTPKLIKKEYLKDMKNGSVIVDVAVDQGGCCETTHQTYHDDPTYIVDGVVHYCVGNIPGVVPNTSTVALTNATLYYGLKIASKGLESAAKDDSGILNAVNVYKGKITHPGVAEVRKVECTDLNTLI